MSVATSAIDSPIQGARGDDRSLRRFGYAVVAAVFVGLGSWSALAPIESAALAPGVVAVQDSRKTIQHLEGGIVRALHVKEGQWVQQSESLLELEGRQFRAELDALKVQQATFEAAQSRLLAERDGLPTVQFPLTANLPLDDARVVEARSGQQALFAARRKAYEGEVAVLKQTAQQLQAQISGLESVNASKRELIESYEQEIADLRKLLTDGFVDRQRLRDYERNVAALSGEVSELDSTVAAVAAAIGEAELRMLQVQRDFQASVAAELGETLVKLSDTTERLNAAEDRVDRALIRAPVTGRVLNLSVHTVGGVVSPGTPLMDIVPAQAGLVIEAHISPFDIERVHAGLEATVRLSGLRFDRQQRLRGNVLTVSADRLLDERTGAAYYSAQVTIDADELQRLDHVTLQPGMPAEVMINTGSHTMLGYLWEPIGSAIERSFRED
jgi:epimerase transport system membrane fusion protein